MTNHLDIYLAKIKQNSPSVDAKNTLGTNSFIFFNYYYLSPLFTLFVAEKPRQQGAKLGALYQTMSRVYAILGILRTKLWCQDNEKMLETIKIHARLKIAGIETEER